MRLEQSGHGLIAVVTMDAPPKPTATIAGQPVVQEQLDLSIAPGVQDGLGLGRVDVSYPYPVCTGSACPPAAAVGDVQLGAQFLGTVPVSISGNDVRFDLGALRSFPQP